MQTSKAVFLTADNSNPVLDAYRDLNKTIDDMDKKVEHVLKKHEAEFLCAYRNHIAKIKKELAEIKHKSEEQEKMFSANDRIQYLEKEMAIFRDQALRLYNKIQEKTQENQILKSRVRQLEKEQQIMELQGKEQLRAVKIEQMAKTIHESKINDLQTMLRKKQEEIARLNTSLHSLKQDGLRRSHLDMSSGRLGSLASSRKGESLTQKTRKIQNFDSEIKDWFVDCIKAVKREIAIRSNNHNVYNFAHINNIDDFKGSDKYKVLQLFLQNDKLLAWIYEKMFPDRISQLRDKHSHPIELSKDIQTEDMSMSHIDRRLLPKVNRSMKNQFRNSLVLRSGKSNAGYV